MRYAVLVVVLGLLSNDVFASPIKGAGAVTCGTYLQSRKDETWNTEVNWMLGFISSVNHYLYEGENEDGVFGNADVDALGAWMENYCRENPLDSVYAGTVLLVDELIERDTG